MRALILDDDAAAGQLVGRIARAAGFDGAVTAGGADFARQYAAIVPAVVVLDLKSGASHGIEQLRFLETQGYPNAVVLLSGFDAHALAATGNLARALGLKVAGVIAKPIRSDALGLIFEEIKARIEPVTPLRVLQAVRAGELTLDYQPIVSRRGGPAGGIEALVRWNHPSAGLIMPDDFIPVAERSADAIDAVTDWVIANAIAAYVRLRARGLAIPIAVNISGWNLDAMELPDLLRHRLAEARVPPEHFCLELTESFAAVNSSRARDILGRVRDNGVRLALDDFGTGCSSIAIDPCLRSRSISHA
jgi:predicted signal transduction protein with EAL and GGDEF domain